MNKTNQSSPTITFRIPGDWSHPRDLLKRMPDGFRLTPENLVLPDETSIEFIPMPPDDQFPEIFQSSCRRPATADELAVVARYTVNVGLTGPGGSIESARKMMQAAAAIVSAGGAGVFIDNSLMSHGGGDWIEMTEDGGPDAISFAFASIVRSQHEVYTMGMRAIGLPDLLIRPADVDEDVETLIDIVRYVCRSERTIDVGHLLADENGPRFKVVAKGTDEFDRASEIHNPFGRLKIVSIKSLAEGN